MARMAWDAPRPALGFLRSSSMTYLHNETLSTRLQALQRTPAVAEPRPRRDARLT
jgi:hypothetical protein